MKPVVICADDFAQSPGIDAGILDLARLGRVTATSALVLSPRWPAAAREARSSGLAVGLHVDLTSEFARAAHGAGSLSALMARIATGNLDPHRVEEIIREQWSRYGDAMGRTPDFLDGHQHVHQLPVVRDVLIRIAGEAGWAEDPRHWIRSCRCTRWRGPKAWLVSVLGSAALAEKLRSRRITTNSDFTGIYNFSAKADLEHLWRHWLADLNGPAPLIMCHVARADAAAGNTDTDPIAPAREHEFRWLKSDAFRDLLASLSVQAVSPISATWPMQPEVAGG